MAAKRTGDIKSSLEFARDSWRELNSLISEAQKSDGVVKHIGHKVGGILQSTRQCFDYCAADLAEDFLPGYQGSSYYPFHPDSLGKGRPFHALSTTTPHLYSKLLEIAEKIRDRKIVDRTLSLHSDVRAVNDLVNAKKHDSVTEIGEQQQAMTRVEFPNGAIITMSPVANAGPEGVADFSQVQAASPSTWTVSPGVNLKVVKNFLLPDNFGLSRRDVGGFCMVSIVATRFILSEVYATAYNFPANIFHE